MSGVGWMARESVQASEQREGQPEAGGCRKIILESEYARARIVDRKDHSFFIPSDIRSTRFE
jgi:hypothetical protein